MFTGQGAQHVNMGRDLYQAEAVFRDDLDRSADILRPHLRLDLREVLYPSDDRIQESARLLDETWIAQPALFAVEHAFAGLWQSWGVRPDAMIGHSLGEYVAACLAGVFSLPEALSLVAARGSLMQALPGGAMLAVPLTTARSNPSSTTGSPSLPSMARRSAPSRATRRPSRNSRNDSPCRTSRAVGCGPRVRSIPP